jgi:hypothetical protein
MTSSSAGVRIWGRLFWQRPVLTGLTGRFDDLAICSAAVVLLSLLWAI